MSVHNIGKHNFHQEVLSSEKPVLLDFWAPWCSPCRMLSPVLEEIARLRPDVKVCKVNVEEEQELAAKYKVFSIPTVLVMQNGAVEDKMVGARPKNQILAMLG
ncbi:MAG: thioredoxin [Oscillospiraceae bacterium]|nr:thioredoxin [Oscillospiraceae bacterium]